MIIAFLVSLCAVVLLLFSGYLAFRQILHAHKDRTGYAHGEDGNQSYPYISPNDESVECEANL